MIILLWVLNHFTKKNKKINLRENQFICCEYCHCPYLAEVSKAITQCPDCHSYNKNIKKK